jgi:hypothetical protein
VRIHSSHASDVYLRVRSRPIIEHSNGLRFAPYAVARLLQHQQPATAAAGDPMQLQAAFAAAGFGGGGNGSAGGVADGSSTSSSEASGDNDLWRCVDDFGWVKASASPHWAVLPAEQRQSPPAQLPASHEGAAGAGGGS